MALPRKDPRVRRAGSARLLARSLPLTGPAQLRRRELEPVSFCSSLHAPCRRSSQWPSVPERLQRAALAERFGPPAAPADWPLSVPALGRGLAWLAEPARRPWEHFLPRRYFANSCAT